MKHEQPFKNEIGLKIPSYILKALSNDPRSKDVSSQVLIKMILCEYYGIESKYTKKEEEGRR
ncbi:hypothetical protein CGT68_17850 [Vibrio cholerae]|uniref:hypothetical protein n=1 Tax=Vibrio cholerae TaxID=666 RepID=UPI000BA8F730|nr:hypothetical protein [Vibrio cholerae]PAS39887.1 hypothetical protein CGT68_17850 [Vibrio cholerae]PAS40336.1 hypothetical protein CGT69_14750 [Vibrio cholerae]